MKRVAQLLNDMVEDGVIGDYAVFGAVAQMRYTEAVSTFDVDVLVALPEDQLLVDLGAIHRFCESRGFHAEGEAIRVGDWPVQFIPTFDPIVEDALAKAVMGDVDGIPMRVVGADYLAVIALSVGRTKDHFRILSLLEAGAAMAENVGALAADYGLAAKWAAFQERFCEG